MSRRPHRFAGLLVGLASLAVAVPVATGESAEAPPPVFRRYQRPAGGGDARRKP